LKGCPCFPRYLSTPNSVKSDNDRSVARSGRSESVSTAIRRAQIPHFGLHVPELGFCLPLHMSAPGLRPDPKSEELLALMEREAQRLGVLDKPKTSFLFLLINRISQRSARGRAEEREPFVVPHRRDVTVDRFRGLPNSPSCRHLSPPMGPYTLYYGIESRRQELFLLTRISVRILLNKRLLCTASTTERLVCHHYQPAYRSVLFRCVTLPIPAYQSKRTGLT